MDNNQVPYMEIDDLEILQAIIIQARKDRALWIKRPGGPDRLTIGTQIRLEPEELKTCRQIGLARWRYDKKHGVRDDKRDPKTSSLDISIHGAEGEWAFCKLMSLYPDYRTKLPEVKRGKYDCRHPRLGRIDVKTPNGTPMSCVFVAGTKRLGDSDYYFFVARKQDREGPLFTFMGMAHERHVINEENRVLCPSGKPGKTSYRVWLSDLRDLVMRENP